MADLSSNSPPEDGEIVFDTPKESVVDGVDEQTPRSANNRRHQRSTSSSSKPRSEDEGSRVTKATRVDPLTLQVKLVLIQSDRVASKSYLLRLNTKMMPNTRDSTRAQKPAKNLS